MTSEDLANVKIVIAYFKVKYKAKFNKNPIVNRNKVQWLIVNMLEDLSVKEVKELIDYYVKIWKEPKLADLCYNYDDVIEQRKEDADDLEVRRALLRESQKRTDDFIRKYGNAE